MGLKARVALVVGGGRGIGRAVCERLAADGCTVAVAGRTLAALEAVRDGLRDAGHEATCHELDLADLASVEPAVKGVVTEHGRVDVLVNAAGISYVAPVALSNLDRCEEVLRVNLLGAFALSRAAVRPMIRQKAGRIVHVGSISGDVGAPYNAIYAASKAGLGGLVRSLALEVAALGITVNAVQPGTVRTELFEATHGARAKLKGITLEAQERAMEADSPQRRLVRPDEVAAAVSYLAGDGAAAVNGHLLDVDGGRSVA